MTKTRYNCHCVSKINAKLHEPHKGKYVLWEAEMGTLDSDDTTVILTLPFRKTANGKIEASGFQPNYCPFCGKKYRKEAVPEGTPFDEVTP